ncbi:hypothetical protein [Pseudomonas plecoglossicida]|uniref:hypothetical protein n=1 Tax=Pseudomonas plecoglossicida TaxID=70775 RepID=UPI00051CCAA1|nr:hypothetical protein [Pseudomonas plecoglossicida]KGK24342.1 hypothetical protein GT93_05565 [Pseudomonas plecoglossicida]
MQVDIYRDQDRILIVEDGKGIPRINGAGSEFLDGLTFVRRVVIEDLPTGLKQAEVLQSLRERGFYAARQHVTLTEVEIQD